jgi:SAM-dependent methyltransferase
VHEILKRLRSDERVLDLGCSHGSFRDSECPATVIRCDLASLTGNQFARFVRCDARVLPFADQSFNAVILNHSLEHFENPSVVLSEIKRILRSSAYLYVAVPDASTITDRLYRWLGRGGGHVNQFSDVDSLVQLIQRQTDLPHIGSRLLFTSFSFLNRCNNKGKRPIRIYLLGGGSEWVLRLATFLLRKIDSFIGTRISVYGWACCFGPVLEFDTHPWSNVCVRCGSGHSSERLLKSDTVRRGTLGVRLFRCPTCGVENYFTDDRAYRSMR